MTTITFTQNQIENLQEMTDVNMHTEAMQIVLHTIDEESDNTLASMFAKSILQRISTLKLDEYQGIVLLNAKKAIYRDMKDLGEKVVSNWSQVWGAL